MRDDTFFSDVTWIAPDSWSSNSELIEQIGKYKLGHFIGITPTSNTLEGFKQHLT